MTPKEKCRCCQWFAAEENDDLCKSCKPLVEKFTKKIIKDYDTKRKSNRISK